MRHNLGFWTNPWRPAQDIFGFSPVFDVNDSEESTRTYVPACEVDETGDRFLIHLDMPGFAKEAIKVEVKHNRLIVSAERKEEKPTGDKDNRFFSERRYGRFERIFDLGETVDPEKIDAVYQDGVLKITLGKAEIAKPKLIEVKGEPSKVRSLPV